MSTASPRNIAFTSDLHLGHDKPFIVEKRDFRSLHQHDRAITDALQDLRCDHLYIVGDVAMGTDKVNRVVAFIESLPYPVTLVRGNHDPSVEALRALTTVAQCEVDLAPGVEATLCHYPANFVDHRGRDFTSHMPPDDGRILIHGHTHREEKYQVTGNGTHQLHVGWDAWQRPVFAEELLQLIAT